MAHHTVRQGESVISLSKRYGVPADKIWDDPDNSSLRENGRKINLLYPGDVVSIPEKEVKEIDVQTGQRHRFRCSGRTAQLQVQFRDNGEPLANEPYVLDVDGELSNGNLDGEGILDVQVPTEAREAIVSIGEQANQKRYRLNLSHLDPVNEITGVQQRLNNLGFFCGREDSDVGELTRVAIRKFQEANDLDVTGEVDDQTRDKIQQEHGS